MWSDKHQLEPEQVGTSANQEIKTQFLAAV